MTELSKLPEAKLEPSALRSKLDTCAAWSDNVSESKHNSNFWRNFWVFVLFGVTASRLNNVTDDHCHSRLRSQIFPVSRSGIILTVCFVRKRTLLTFWAFWEAEGAQKAKSALFLAKQTYEKWHHFFALAKICSVPAECQWRLVTLSKRGFRARVKMYLAATAQMYLVLRPKWTWPQILPPKYHLPVRLFAIRTTPRLKWWHT